ncbi:MAG: hypothetical protein P0Y65_19970 [Candidatus Devosia phytovorans]|uniref:DUF1849 family protein n=1 Tax=Candidatus Devosia phytovorans TaxID=3121372 RepID=A0AAJ5VU79_9HYPH|nr:hypothetical protein [Devosia sp.]WEK04422.1 MAG: hypothetical protein P0Y65_19970 [Devosia sp.]
MRRAHFLTGLILLAPLPAHAQTDKKAPPPPQTCDELVIALDAIERTPETTVEDTADGCRLTNFYIGTDTYTRYRIAGLELRAPTLLEDFVAERPPAELDLAITGFANAPDTGSPNSNYLIEIQSEPMDMHFHYRWDQQSHTVEVSDFSVTAPGDGAIRLAGRLSSMNFDPKSLDSFDDIPGAFDQLTVEFSNALFVSALLAPALIGNLPYDEDPRPIIADYQQSAVAFIEGLPAETMSDDSKAALASFITTFPRATGDYAFELRADPPFEFASIDLDEIDGLLPLLQRLQLAVSHTPADEP